MGNSSSTPSSSTTTNTNTNTNTNGEKYDVFISFRGEDTRNGFTSHLYQALHEKQIKTFIDNQLKRGEEISDGLWSAIGESKISVIIFSENYTSSKWCLLELAKIMKYREKKKQIVIPVFYKVEPSDVRTSYEAAFAKHTNEWRPALTEASKISGIVVPKGR